MDKWIRKNSSVPRLEGVPSGKKDQISTVGIVGDQVKFWGCCLAEQPHLLDELASLKIGYVN